MKSNAFSLVELSIVLVILGLLTGGILTGQSLIRAAELRAVATEAAQWQKAINVFEQKYFALPGDMPNAEDYWGTMSIGSCPFATGGTGTQTCNGDGNGRIYTISGSGNETNEVFTFWQHLANANLINGEYTGISGSADEWDATINENVPASAMGGVGWFAGYLDNSGGSSDTYAYNYQNFLVVGTEITGSWTGNSFLTPEEAWNIDTKIDDGLPAKGCLIALYWNNWCAAANDGTHATDDFDASYRLDNDAIACPLIFKDAF